MVYQEFRISSTNFVIAIVHHFICHNHHRDYIDIHFKSFYNEGGKGNRQLMQLFSLIGRLKTFFPKLVATMYTHLEMINPLAVNCLINWLCIGLTPETSL